MNARAVRSIWLRELKIHVRDKARVVSSVSRSVLWLVIFGSGLGAARFAGLGMGYQEFLFPGVIAMSILFTSMHSGISVIWDREFGFMKEILVSPASRFSIMVGKVLGGSTIAVFEGMIILLLGPLVGVKLTATKIAVSIVLMFLMSLSLVSIGLVVSSIMKSFEGFQTIMTFLIMPMFFLSGAVFPLDKIPVWMKPLTILDPLTYGVDALRITLIDAGHNGLLLNLAVMAATAAVTVCAGTVAFKNTE